VFHFDRGTHLNNLLQTAHIILGSDVVCISIFPVENILHVLPINVIRLVMGRTF
jgi:hypothetical protein